MKIMEKREGTRKSLFRRELRNEGHRLKALREEQEQQILLYHLPLLTVWALCCLCRSTDIFDYTYIDAFGKGKQLTVKECEYLIGHHVTEEFYGVVTSKEVLQRMVGNLLNLGKR